jgi:hypothetical protein
MAFFNYDRKRWATEDIATCYECAEKAGMKDALFVNFGLVLGIVREGDFLGHDDDVDMAIDMDFCTKEQQDAYISYLDEAGMFFARKRISRRPDTKAATWFTLRRNAKRAKFCHWCGFSHQGFWFWCKVGLWLTTQKFSRQRWGWNENTQGIMLGIPADYIREKMWIDFRGIKIQIPKHYGSVLDWEYPGWPVPKKGGSSKKQVVCIVDDWTNPKKWRVKMG